MALTVRADPVEKVTTANLLATLSLPEQRKAAADFARDGLEEAKRINQAVFGTVPPYTTTVDGQKDAPLDSVNPNGGSIIFEFELIGNVLQWIAKELQDRSPIVSGAYRRGHKLFADGSEVPITENIRPAEEYVFANTVEYARKIEVGKTHAGRAFVIQVPNKIYERVADDARKQFGLTAAIQYGFRDVTGNRTSSPAIIVRYKKI